MKGSPVFTKIHQFSGGFSFHDSPCCRTPRMDKSKKGL
jgi:hypothetical protein